MRQYYASSVCLDFEFCGLDIVATVDGDIHLLEINRLPGLESSTNNQEAEDMMYDRMMTDLLHLSVLQSLHSIQTRHAVGDSVGTWDCVAIAQPTAETVEGEVADKGQVEMMNLLRWKVFTRQRRREVLADFN